jgi:hypothetical protein
VKLKLLGTAAALVLLVMLGVAYSLRLDPEIAQANEALHAATSWRVSLEMHPASGAGLWGKVAVICPDREDLELTGAQAGHTIRVGDQWWTDGLPSTDNGQTPNPCLFGKDQPVLFGSQVARAMAITAEFDRAVRHHASFSRGPQRTLEKEACREWTVDEAYTVCLGLDDHLPRDFKARDGSVLARFTEWNQEITIEPPGR